MLRFGRIRSGTVWFLLALLLYASQCCAESGSKSFTGQVLSLSRQCRDEVVGSFESFVRSGTLTPAQLFDTFYVPIQGTYPQKYHTSYDSRLDETLRKILDRYLKKDWRFVYFIVTDVNGYVPAHNSRFSKGLTGNREKDSKSNRTKLIFNDRTGLAAARNKAPYLLQEYPRDTGETIYDLSVPIMFRGRHWGCVRVGYTP